MSLSMNFHRVTKIELSETTHNEMGSRQYDVRKLTIHHDGKTTEIDFFSDDLKDDDQKPLAFIV